MRTTVAIRTIVGAAAAAAAFLPLSAAFGTAGCAVRRWSSAGGIRPAFLAAVDARRARGCGGGTALLMSDSGGGGGAERQKSKKKGLSTIVIEKTETKMEEDKKKEDMWRLVLHNDEVNTFQHVQRALCTVVSTLDRKRAFDICMETHGIGKATITKTWRQKAEQYCLNLQRQGLTVSIAPDKAFEGGGADGKGPDMS